MPPSLMRALTIIVAVLLFCCGPSLPPQYAEAAGQTKSRRGRNRRRTSQRGGQSAASHHLLPQKAVQGRPLPAMVDTAAAERVRFTYTDAGGGERDLDDDLRLACNSADLERASELLLVRRELGAAEVGLVDRHPRDRYANSPLHDVARRGLVDVAELLLDEGGYDVDVANGMGDRPLHMSAASGHLSMTKTLLQSGAQVDPRTVWGMTPLWWAVSGDSSDDNSAAHFRVAELLLRHGADVSARTSANHTVLMEAARRGHAGMAQLLIDAGTSAHALDGLGETALHKAAASGHAHVARVLLQAGLSADVTNLGGETALDVATRARRGNVVALLLAMATPPSTNASSSSQPALASGPNSTALGDARPIESDDDELTLAPAPSVSTAAASSASSSSSAAPSSSCPHGVRHPDKLCGHLEPQAYIEELRSGPATLYANLRRHPQLFGFDAQEGEAEEEEEASDAAAGWPLHWFAPGVRAVLSNAAAAGHRSAGEPSVLIGRYLPLLAVTRTHAGPGTRGGVGRAG